MLRYRNKIIFLLRDTPKIRDTVPWTYANGDLNGEPITGSFYEKELQKTSQEKFTIEK